jgi:hypothetical protein
MPPVHLVAIACVAAAALLAACSSPSGVAAGDAWSREHAVVSFSYEAVDPETARIAPDGNVTWVNLEQDARGFVVFPASIASSFACDDLEPYFRKVVAKAADVYRSLPITATQSERVRLPCSLAPGSYDYEIWLQGSGVGEEFDAGQPEQILRAKIVVE